MAHCRWMRLVKLASLLVAVGCVLVTVRFIAGRVVPKSDVEASSVSRPHVEKLLDVRSERRTDSRWDRPAAERRYVVGWNFWEQLMMATANYFCLVWLASQWRARAVTPFTQNSGLYGVPSWNGKPALPFDLIFNQTAVNEALHERGQPPLTKFPDFVRDSVRNLTVLHLFYNGEDLGYFSRLARKSASSRDQLVSRLNADFVVDCCHSPYIQKITNTFLTSLNAKSPKTRWFHATNCFCINASYPIDPDILAQRCGILYNQSYTVVVNNWRGVTGGNELRSTEKGVLNNFRMFVPSFDGRNVYHPGRDVYPYSFRVDSFAAQFRQDLVGNADFVAVHFRGEKLGLRDKRMLGYFKSCWQEVQTLLRTQFLSYSKETVLYFTDSSSLTCHSNCRGAQLVAKAFGREGIVPVQFHPYEYGSSVSDKGLVAVVEQSTAAMAKHVILVGGGSFQAQLHTRFRSRSSSGQSYSVCWKDNIDVKIT